MSSINNGKVTRFARLRALRQRRRIIQLLLQGEATNQIARAFRMEGTTLLDTGNRSRLGLALIVPPTSQLPVADEDNSPGHAEA